MRISEMAAMALSEIPNYYEPGWEWWAYTLAAAGLVVAAFLMALAVPLAFNAGEWLEGARGRVAWRVAAWLAVLAAVIGGFMLPGALMRHMPTAGGVGWIIAATLALGFIAWWWVGGFLSERYSRYVAALPAAVFVLSVVNYGFAELVTRTAASVPMSVGALLTIVVVLIGGIFFYGKTAR